MYYPPSKALPESNKILNMPLFRVVKLGSVGEKYIWAFHFSKLKNVAFLYHCSNYVRKHFFVVLGC